MRELKFRMLTQTTDKILGYVDIYDLLRNGSDVLPDFAEAVLHGVKFEQYTGLKDRNGKEIYEGDIVKTNSPDRANFNAGVIVIQQQMYLIINTPTYGDARLSHSEPLGYYCDMECEIIGNIHENPELLGGEE